MLARLPRLLRWLSSEPPPQQPQPFSVQDCEKQLDRLCDLQLVEQVKQQPGGGEIPEKHIQDISTCLDVLDKHHGRSGEMRWGSRPRLYAILHIIHGLQFMKALVEKGATDYSLPYTDYSLPRFSPEGIDDPNITHLRQAFLENQRHFYTSAKGIEEPSSKHHTFAPNVTGDFYFIPRKKLGQGSFGSVDLVTSRLSLESYARKRVLRARTQRAADCQRSLVNELQALRRLSHDHLVRIMGSYTDKEYIAYLMLPVAQYTLGQILVNRDDFEPYQKAAMRRYYGCLAGALHYLHENQIRHRDLSANNILIHGGEVYISDFGSAYSWTNKSGSQTRHRTTPASPDYMAPETAKDEVHGKASDMWSLGIIFLEMATRLLGRPLKEYKNAIILHSKKNKAYPHPYANVPALVNWLDGLSKIDSESDHDKEPLAWTRSLIHSQQEHRPSTRMLMQDILESPSFHTFCCFKCSDAFQGDTDPEILPERAPLHTGTFSTFSTVQDMLERSEDAAPFGGLSTNRLGSIKDWAATVESGPGAESAPDGVDMEQFESRIFDARYSSQAMFGNYEANLFSSTPIQDPTTFLGNKPNFDLDSPKETGEALHRVDTVWRTEEYPGEPKLPRRQGYVNEPLEDFGLGFLERESVSSADERSAKPFDEVSDCSTAGSDFESCTSNDFINGRLQMIMEEDERSQGLGFDEASDKSETELKSRSPVKAEVPLHGDQPGTEVPVEKIIETVLPYPKAQNDESHEVFLSEDPNASGVQAEPSAISLPSGSHSLQGPGEKETVLDITPESIFPEETQAQGFESFQPPKVNSKRNGEGDINSLPSQKSANKKAVRFDDYLPAPPVPGDDHLPKAVFSNSEQEENPALMTETSQASLERHDLSKSNLGKLNDGNKKSRTTRDPKPREKCTGVDVVKLMSQSWEKASETPTSNMSEATRKKLSVALFSFASQRDITAILNAHCKDGKANAVKAILQNQTQRRAHRAKYHSPLWSAVKGRSERHNKCVRELIDADVDVNITSKRTGKSPLHAAVEHADFEGYTSLIWLLINASAKLDALDFDGDSPLIKLFLGNDHEPLAQHRRAALAILLRAGARIDVRQRATGSTPLHLAVRRQDKWAVAMLLFKGADVNAKTSSGTTPLQITANQFRGDLSPDHAEVLYLLLQHEGVRVDEPAGALKRTALHLAVISGTAHAVEMLIQHGASTKTKDKEEDDAMMLAVKHASKLINDTSKTLDRRLDDHVEIMRLLSAEETEWPLSEAKCVVEVACRRPDNELLKKLLEQKLNPNDNFGDHGTILKFTSEHGSSAARDTLSRFPNAQGLYIPV